MIFSHSRSQALAACPFRRREALGIPLAEIEALYDDSAVTVFADSARNRRFCHRSTQVHAVATIVVAKFSGGVLA